MNGQPPAELVPRVDDGRGAPRRHPARRPLAALGLGAALAVSGAAAASEARPPVAEPAAAAPSAGAVPVGLRGLVELGDVRPVPDAPAAAAATGLDVPEVVSRPRGVVGEPTYLVADEAWVAIWSSGRRPTLAVGRAVVAPDVPPVPAIGPELAAWMDRLGAGGAVLRRVAADAGVTTSEIDVEGLPATVLSTGSGTVAAVVWREHGIVTGVVGTSDVDELVAVARELR